MSEQIGSIWKLGGLKPGQLARQVIHEVSEDNLLGRASELAFNFLLAIFPAMLFLLAIFGLFAAHAALLKETLLGYFADFLPPSAYQIFVHTLDEVTSKTSGGKITFGIFLSLWFASGAMTSMISTLNVAYRLRERRSWLKVQAVAVGLVVVISLLVLSALVVVALGGDVAEIVGSVLRLQYGVVLVWKVVHWPLAAGFVVLAFSIIYYHGPDIKQRQWYWMTPGSLVGVVLWLAASGLFRAYLHFFNTYTRAYGSLGAVLILLMWLYVTGFAFLAGGEINAVIERAAERGPPEAKAPGQKK
jgi:membrane protein